MHLTFFSLFIALQLSMGADTGLNMDEDAYRAIILVDKGKSSIHIFSQYTQFHIQPVELLSSA